MDNKKSPVVAGLFCLQGFMISSLFYFLLPFLLLRNHLL
jgi:hypothetical protein